MTRTFPGVTLHLGDCLDVLPTIEAGSVDAVVTDPPYNVGLKYATDDDNKPDYWAWCHRWFEMLRAASRGPIAITTGQTNLSMWASHFPPDWWLAWWKPAAMGRCVIGFNNWEPIAVYGKPHKGGCDVLRATIRPDKSLSGHPCPKPLEWATKQIEMLCPPGGTVLDPFIGSGTTAVAALNTGRQCIGIEREPAYHDIACRRVTEALDRTALLNPIVS